MRVGRTYIEINIGNIIIPSITDQGWYNNDQITLYRYYPDKYSWGEAVLGRIQVVVGVSKKMFRI